MVGIWCGEHYWEWSFGIKCSQFGRYSNLMQRWFLLILGSIFSVPQHNYPHSSVFLLLLILLEMIQLLSYVSRRKGPLAGYILSGVQVSLVSKPKQQPTPLPLFCALTRPDLIFPWSLLFSILLGSEALGLIGHLFHHKYNLSSKHYLILSYILRHLRCWAK